MVPGLLLQDQKAKDWMTRAAVAKLSVVPSTMEVVEISRRIHGACGYTKEFKVERLYRAIAGATAIAVSLEINRQVNCRGNTNQLGKYKLSQLPVSYLPCLPDCEYNSTE